MPPPVAATFPGPAALGRGAVVGPGGAAPDALSAAPRVVVDDEVADHPAAVVALLHDHWIRRRPVVVELAADNDQVRAPEVSAQAPYAVSPDFAFERERLHFLLWANTYDLRGGHPVWWHGELARRRGAQPPGSSGDITLPDGRDAWVDGGPRGPVGLAGGDALPVVHRESVALGRLTVQGDALPTEPLAPDQLAAVTHGSGPARIIAPAGSGKTRVLTARLRHLLQDRNVETQLVTAVAYNTRAAEEMRARTTDLGASIRTLHSLALWICRMDVRREVIGDRDQRALLERLVTVARVPNTDPYQPWLEALAEVRLALRDPVEVEARRGDVDGFAEVFPRYRQELARRGLLDFDEQIYRALELLLTRPDLRQRAQRAGTHLLVDEFQDLTPAFLLLVRLVAGPSLQVFAVGDDDQTIYSYAGATPDYLVDFHRWFPGAASHPLEVNYRCPREVVDSAVRLLGHNRRRVPKTIRAGAGQAGLGVHRTSSGAMADRAVALLRERLEAGAAPTQLAVLARVNSALLPIQVALADAGIPSTAPLDTTVLGRTGIRAALAYLRLGMDPDRLRRDDLLETLNRPTRKVKSVVEPYLRRSRWWTMRQLTQIGDGLDGAAQERFVGYLGDLHHLQAALREGVDTGRALWLVRNRIGLGEAMDALDSSRTRPEGSSHGDDLDALEQLAARQPDPAAFREWLVERLRVPGDPAGVTLSTVHRVKGMEWAQVVIFGANQGLFPHRLSEDMEEERRIFHVALTRCRDRVDIVADRERCSPFIGELSATPPTHRAATTAAVPVPDPVTVRRRPDGAAAHGGPRDEPVDEDLFEALRAWRARIAAEQGVPAYLVFHDRHLRTIAARRPGSARELAACPGVGPAKLERYGDDVLTVVDRHG